MAFERALLTTLAALAGAFGLLLMWLRQRIPIPWKAGPTASDPVFGAWDQAAHDRYGLVIPMPDHLKTHDEMVEWMTRELPKRTTKLTRTKL